MSSSTRMASAMNTAYTELRVIPTTFLRRYLDQVRIRYRASTANIRNIIVNSMPYDWISIWASVVEAPPIMVFTNHGTPSDIRMANELAPRELDTPNPPSPVNRDKSVSYARHGQEIQFIWNPPRRVRITHDIASGRQPPQASSVIPITVSGMPKVTPIMATIQ